MALRTLILPVAARRLVTGVPQRTKTEVSVPATHGHYSETIDVPMATASYAGGRPHVLPNFRSRLRGGPFRDQKPGVPPKPTVRPGGALMAEVEDALSVC